MLSASPLVANQNCFTPRCPSICSANELHSCSHHKHFWSLLPAFCATSFIWNSHNLIVVLNSCNFCCLFSCETSVQSFQFMFESLMVHSLIKGLVPIASRARCDRAYPGRNLDIHDLQICAWLDRGDKDTRGVQWCVNLGDLPRGAIPTPRTLTCICEEIWSVRIVQLRIK